MRKPPKRLYADYYQVIKQPIALEDIKAKIEKGSYPTLEDVRLDFELCFNNAKEYNQKESLIWRDAKDLMVCLGPLHKPSGLTILAENRQQNVWKDHPKRGRRQEIETSQSYTHAQVQATEASGENSPRVRSITIHLCVS